MKLLKIQARRSFGEAQVLRLRPPDVRKACCLPLVATPINRGYAPERGRSPKSLRRFSRQV
jgi:hypothetical protein